MAKFDRLKKSMGDFYLKNKNLQKKEILKSHELKASILEKHS